MRSAVRILLILIALSSIGAVYADPNDTNGSINNSNGENVPVSIFIDPTLLYSGLLTIQVSQSTVHVNDTVEIVVTATNTGLVDWCPLKIYMPVPPGTEFVSFVAPNKNLQNYDPITGIWDVYRMRHYERGQQKTGILTVKVTDSAAGKTLPVVASFYQLVLEGYGVDMVGNVPSARSTSITVLPIIGSGKDGDDPGNTNGDNPGNTTGTDPNGKSTGNGQDKTTVNGNLIKSNILTNLTQSSDKSPSKSLQEGGGGGGGNTQKAFQIDQIAPLSKNDTLSYLIAVFLILGMIVAGYYYGIKRDD